MPENYELKKTLWAAADKLRSNMAATLEEVRKNNHVLMPGRYVGTEAEKDDGTPLTTR